MKVLLLYAGKTGTCKKCADIICQKLKEVKVINLSCETEDINCYDFIIIGGSIRMGQLHKKVRKFIKYNLNALKTKKVAYFICNVLLENTKQYFDKNIPKDLLEQAVIYNTFGGELDINKQRGLDKIIVKMINKSDKNKKEATILLDNINHFISNIK